MLYSFNVETDRLHHQTIIGVDLGGAARARAPIIEKPHTFITFYHLSPNILVCPPNICEKSTPVHHRITADQQLGPTLHRGVARLNFKRRQLYGEIEMQLGFKVYA